LELLNTVLDLVQHMTGPGLYFVIFGILLLCGFGLPLPEDVVLFAAGMLSYKGLTDIHLMVAVAFAGVMIGDGTIFLLGHKYGSRLTRKPFFERILSPEKLAGIKDKFHEHGNKIVFAARFMPGLRTPVFFTAGTLHLPFRVFLFYDGMAALISVPVITYAVWYFGSQVEYVVNVVRSVEHGVVFLIVAVIAFVAAKIWWGRRAHRKAAAQSRIDEA
jgi:membrane protein DedA with SNARE-associated domain